MAMPPLSQVQAEQGPTQPIPIPPLPPVPPTIVSTEGGTVVIRQAGVPTTAREVEALRRRGSELSRQLNSVSGRRDRLARQLEDASGANKTGIEARITQLDQRILGLENDIAINGRLLAAAPANLLAQTTEEPSTPAPFNLRSGQVTAISIVGTIFIGFPLAMAIARNMFRRASRRDAVGAGPSPESTQRMERLEQAVDAIAIEVERISEGQRFMTRMLTEGSGPALSVAQNAAEPVRLPERDSLRASRGSA
jgi:hypothetical protein